MHMLVKYAGGLRETRSRFRQLFGWSLVALIVAIILLANPAWPQELRQGSSIPVVQSEPLLVGNAEPIRGRSGVLVYGDTCIGAAGARLEFSKMRGSLVEATYRAHDYVMGERACMNKTTILLSADVFRKRYREFARKTDEEFRLFQKR